MAISDPLGIIASPHSTIDRKKTPQYIPKICELIREMQIVEVVVGLPTSMKGTDTDQTRIVRSFIDELSDVLQIPIMLTDERLSSVSATKRLVDMGIDTGRDKSAVDAAAASIILQEYLDST